MIATNAVLLAVYSGLLVAAALQDLRSLRIANWLSVATLLSAILLLVFARTPERPWEHLISFAAVLGVGILLFARGWLGGGDTKIAAAAAALFSLKELAWFLVAMSIAGGLLTILLLLLRSFTAPASEPGSGWLGLRRGRAIPYGVAIAAGAILVAWQVVPVERTTALPDAIGSYPLSPTR